MSYGSCWYEWICRSNGTHWIVRLLYLTSRVTSLETLTGNTTLVIRVSNALQLVGNSTLVATINEQGNTIGQMSGLTGITALVTTIGMQISLLSSLQLANATLAGRLTSLETLAGSSLIVTTVNQLNTTVGQLSGLTVGNQLINTVNGLSTSVGMQTMQISALQASNI